MALHTAGMLQLLQPLLGKRDTQTSLSLSLHAKTCTHGHKGTESFTYMRLII